MANGTQPSQLELQHFNRFAKILYFTLFGTVGMYWLVLGMLAPGIQPREFGVIKTVFLALGGATAVAVLYFRFAGIPPLLTDLSADPKRSLVQLRTAHILCYVLSEAVALYGFVLRVLGAGQDEVTIFFIAAVVLFVLCYPRMPAVLGGPHAST